jgi:hypothetical protein
MIDRSRTSTRYASVSVMSAKVTNTTIKPYLSLHLVSITLIKSLMYSKRFIFSRLFIKELYKYPIKLIKEQILTTGENGVYTNGNLRWTLLTSRRLNSQPCYYTRLDRWSRTSDHGRVYFFIPSVNRESIPPILPDSEGAWPSDSEAGAGAVGTSPSDGVSSNPPPDAEWKELSSPVVGCSRSRAGAFSSLRDKTRSEAASSASAASASGSSSWGFSFFST